MLASVILAATGTFVIAAPAQAAPKGYCDLGFSCVYRNEAYGGSSYGTAQARYFLKSSGMSNVASSVSANGKNCKQTHYYDATDKPAKMIFNSRYRVGSAFRDPVLSNGGGLGIYSKQNWDNRISLIIHTSCS